MRLPLFFCLPMLAWCAQPILDSRQENPRYEAKTANWAAGVCGGHTYFVNETPPYEWVQVIDPAAEADNVPVAAVGTVVSPSLSQNDVPFTHPFGLDWQFSIALDPPYDALLAPGNLGPDSEFVKATRHAAALGLPAKKGVLGVETDRDLVPAAYRAQEGDRVVILGRWIADCGHSDFHTEIHPPLLIATARAEGAATVVSVIGRPWLVGQRFETDGEPIRRHLVNEVVKVETFRSTRVEAHPKILPPFSRPVRIEFTVRPPKARRSPRDRLAISQHLTARPGVTFEILRDNPDAVTVRIAFDPATYTAAPLPRRKDWNIPLAFIGRRTDVIDKIQIANLIGHPIAGLLLRRDWLTDRYEAPPPSSFPIYGSLRVEWNRRR